MANIKEIVNRMGAMNSMRQITKTMKLIAASKFNRAQQNLFKIKNYEKYLDNVKNKILNDLDYEVVKRYRNREKKDNLLLIVCTADKGFCGSFNNIAIKKGIEVFNDNVNTYKKISILPIGKKAFTYFKKNGYDIIPSFNEMISKLTEDNIREFATWLTQNFLEERFDKILFVYNNFKNAASQEITVKQFLPMEIAINEDKVYPEEYLFEPTREEVIGAFIPFYLQTYLTHLLFESNASEQGARMTNMTKATDNADALIKGLRIQYNQSRQTMITNEIIEISAGANAIQ